MHASVKVTYFIFVHRLLAYWYDCLLWIFTL